MERGEHSSPRVGAPVIPAALQKQSFLTTQMVGDLKLSQAERIIHATYTLQPYLKHSRM